MRINSNEIIKKAKKLSECFEDTCNGVKLKVIDVYSKVFVSILVEGEHVITFRVCENDIIMHKSFPKIDEEFEKKVVESLRELIGAIGYENPIYRLSFDVGFSEEDVCLSISRNDRYTKNIDIVSSR